MASSFPDPNRAGNPKLQVDLVLYWYIVCLSISMLDRTGKTFALLRAWYNWSGVYASSTKEHVMSTHLDRITIDPDINHGKPVIRGLRYPVENMLELLSSGMTIEEILADYEDLEREDILAVLEYATRLSQVKRIEVIVA